jgi:hypothetical protein
MGPLGYPIPVLRSLNADAGANQAHHIFIRFDVSTIAPYERINQVSQNSYPTQSGFYARYDESWRQNFGLDDPIYHLMTSVFDGNDEIASLYVDQAMAIEPFARLVDTDQFDNRQKITIESEIWLQDDAGINAFLLDFNVVNVPEPVSAHALIMGLTLITIASKRRR